MSDICPTCGLSKELCVCESIAKESQKIRAYLDNKKFNKTYTIIEGIDAKSIDMKELAKNLKGRFACGGTIKEGRIELQGNHLSKVRKALIEFGFAPESVDID